MKNWTIGRRLVVGFGAVVAITIGLGIYGSSHLSEVVGHTSNITADALPGVVAMGEVRTLIAENYGLTAWHVASRDAKELADIEARMKDGSAQITKLYEQYEKASIREEDRRLFDAIAGPRAAYTKTRNEQVLRLSKAGDKQKALELYRTAMTSAYKNYVAAVGATFNQDKHYGEAESAAASHAGTTAEFGLFAGMVAAAVLAGGVAFLIIRTTNSVLRGSVTELSHGAQQVASASCQVAGAAQSLSQGATEQAASLEETSASMEEMASMTRKNAENSQGAAAMMSETERLVEQANGALGDMVTSMTAIKESSDKVAKIIKTIDEIAFQTNILALNAAVEAARAGEAGMGFAVVADEVRTLAQRSAQAARDTAGLIEASIATSQEGQKRVALVAETIGSITGSTSRVKGLIEQVSEASHQQSQGIDQVSKAIAEMEKVTQSTAATAEESAAASEELSAQAEMSMQVVRRLSTLVGIASVRVGGRTTVDPQRSASDATVATPRRARAA